MLLLAEAGCFRENFNLLGAVFEMRALPHKDQAGLIELTKADFVHILKESGLLIAGAKADDKKDAKAPAEGETTAPAIKFEEQEVYEIIEGSQSFDYD